MGSLDSLKTKAEFDFVYRNGFYRYGKNFALYACMSGARSMNSGMSGSMDMQHAPITLGLSISRKVGNAVTRNLLKRRVRMLCRESKLPELSSLGRGGSNTGAGAPESRLELVFVAKSGIAAMSFAELKDSFDKTLGFILQHLAKGFTKGSKSRAPRHKNPAQKPAMQTSLYHPNIANNAENSVLNGITSRAVVSVPNSMLESVQAPANSGAVK